MLLFSSQGVLILKLTHFRLAPRFVVEDEKYNYISARYPGDAQLFAEEIIKLLESFNRIQ